MTKLFEVLFCLAGILIIPPILYFFIVCFQTLFEQGHWYIGGVGMILIISLAGMFICAFFESGGKKGGKK